MWVFGYGSLCWKTDFPYEQKLNGFIKGYIRRFYQMSVFHRGVPEKPGRVVTLIPSKPEDQVWGVAYFVSKENERRVSEQLDIREKNGYVRTNITFYPENNDINTVEPFEITMYIGEESNQFYGGRDEIKKIATIIAHSKGNSGTNTEYLFNLAQAMRSIAPDEPDEHLFSLEEEVKKILQSETKTK